MTKSTSSSTIQSRPPIVTIMGHIDHGKTSLLDKIRSTTIAARESGGITQHIGAYQAQGITFIDTPGHAAFCNMRARGAQITDIVVLVVSAVDGLMDQTKECLDLIKKTGVTFIVAMNKMDLAGANVDKVKGQLVEAGFTPEEYGGQIPCLPVSAKTGQGIDHLLAEIKLHAEVMELKSEPDVPVEAIVIESRLDKSRGPIASVIVRKGTLKLGDSVFAGSIHCKVKNMVNFLGKNITSAGPSDPVEILGFEKTPDIGSIITSTSIAPNQEIVPKKIRDIEVAKLPVLIKADVQGTLEAILASFSEDVYVVSSGVGAINDNDIYRASASKAQIFAFNVAVPKSVKNLAENEKVRIFESKIIYEIIDDIQSQVLKILEPTIDETITGEANIIAEFNINKVRIAGIHCTKGEFNVGDMIHLKRDDKIIKDTKVEGLRHNKDSVPKAKVGNDYGITFKPYVDFKINDVIISYNKN